MPTAPTPMHTATSASAFRLSIRPGTAPSTGAFAGADGGPAGIGIVAVGTAVAVTGSPNRSTTGVEGASATAIDGAATAAPERARPGAGCAAAPARLEKHWPHQAASGGEEPPQDGQLRTPSYRRPRLSA